MKVLLHITNKYYIYKKKKLLDHINANLEEYVIREEVMKVKKEMKEKNNRI